MFTKLIYIILAIFIGWQLFVYLRAYPDALSKDNLSRSFFTIGVLALILIGFIALLVFLIKHNS